MKRPSPFLHAAALLALTLGNAQAVLLSPTGDTSGALTLSGTTVTKRTLTTAYGTGGSLPISKTRNPLIKFELSGSEVSSAAFREARLTLYFYSVTKAADIQIHVVQEAWDETFPEKSRVMPVLNSPFTTIPASAVVRGKFVVLDVTTEVKAMMDGNNFGFALSSADGLVNAVISSKEGTGTGYAPQLELVSRGILTPGTHNTGAGALTMGSITIGQGNTAFGKEAMVALSEGSSNTATGYGAFKNNAAGNSNTANGYLAMGAGTTGSNNTAVGHYALGNNTADYNTAVGYRALLQNTTAWKNTAIGGDALTANTTGGGNVAIGYQALASNTTGAENTASGFQAMYSNTTGMWNTAFGLFALRDNTTGVDNTAIGYEAGRYVNGLNNTICIGYNAQATQSNMIQLGNDNITLFSCKVGLTVTSDRTKKENFLPVDGSDVLKKIKAMPMTSWNYIGHDAKTQRHYGPMAQDFYAAFGTDAMGTIGSPTTVNTNDMAGVTFSAIQELSKENTELRKKNAKHEQEMHELRSQIEQIRNQIGSTKD